MRRGLTLGQAFVLLLAFGLASGAIFLLGVWVGQDLTEQRLEREQRVVRAAVTPLPPTAAPAAGEPAATPTRTPLPLLSLPSPPAPATRARPTATASPSPSPTATAPPSPTRAAAESAPWLVQVHASPNPVESGMVALRLRQLGFEVVRRERMVGGTVWIQVGVGPFSSRGDAEAAAERLRREAGIRAPMVIRMERP